MFNHQINEHCTNKLRNYCKDKSVLIVGNSLSLFGQEYGSLIDSYDVVIRIGKGVPFVELRPFLGSKTDCWVFSSFRASNYKYFNNVKFKILNFCQYSLYENQKKDMNFDKVLFSEKFQIYKDYFLLGSLEETKNIVKKVNIKNRLSQGIFCIEYFTDKIKTYKKLDIIGFDFFESSVSYKIQNKKNKITINSFHLPILIDAKNPHFDLDGNEENEEKAYILNLEKEQKIGIHKMNHYPSQKTLELLFKKFRPTGYVINKTDIT